MARPPGTARSSRAGTAATRSGPSRGPKAARAGERVTLGRGCAAFRFIPGFVGKVREAKAPWMQVYACRDNADHHGEPVYVSEDGLYLLYFWAPTADDPDRGWWIGSSWDGVPALSALAFRPEGGDEWQGACGVTMRKSATTLELVSAQDLPWWKPPTKKTNADTTPEKYEKRRARRDTVTPEKTPPPASPKAADWSEKSPAPAPAAEAKPDEAMHQVSAKMTRAEELAEKARLLAQQAEEAMLLAQQAEEEALESQAMAQAGQGQRKRPSAQGPARTPSNKKKRRADSKAASVAPEPIPEPTKVVPEPASPMSPCSEDSPSKRRLLIAGVVHSQDFHSAAPVLIDLVQSPGRVDVDQLPESAALTAPLPRRLQRPEGWELEVGSPSKPSPPAGAPEWELEVEMEPADAPEPEPVARPAESLAVAAQEPAASALLLAEMELEVEMEPMVQEPAASALALAAMELEVLEVVGREPATPQRQEARNHELREEPKVSTPRTSTPRARKLLTARRAGPSGGPTEAAGARTPRAPPPSPRSPRRAAPGTPGPLWTIEIVDDAPQPPTPAPRALHAAPATPAHMGLPGPGPALLAVSDEPLIYPANFMTREDIEKQATLLTSLSRFGLAFKPSHHRMFTRGKAGTPGMSDEEFPPTKASREKTAFSNLVKQALGV